MSLIMGQSAPIDPLVFDDEEAIGALASSVILADLFLELMVYGGETIRTRFECPRLV